MQHSTFAGGVDGPAGPSHVEVVIALTWENGRYAARCLGVRDLSCVGESMADAVLALADELSHHFSGGQGLDGLPDRTELWQPLPVEMLTALDVAV